MVVGCLISRLGDSQMTMRSRNIINFVLAAAILVCLTRNAACTENDSTMQDVVAKLSEQMIGMREQLAEMTEHTSEELSKIRSQMTAQSNEQSDMKKKLTSLREDRTEELASVREQIAGQNKQLTHQDELIGELEAKTTAQQVTTGPTFVRWGKKTCNGTGSELVYTGAAGGTGSGNVGGGSNLLCLTRNPTWGNHDDINHFGSPIVGAEYQIDADNNFPFETTDPLLVDNDIPCAVCQVTNGSSLVMIPGTMSCNPDWRMEYKGYLMATDIGEEYKYQFICVDEYAEVGVNGQANGAAVRFVPVEAVCDNGSPTSLLCPPYVDNWEMTCVVCSK